MSYDDALEVRDDVWQMVKHDKTVVLVAVENQGGDFGVVVGSTHPKGVEVPSELDNVAIRVIESAPPSPFEPAD